MPRAILDPFVVYAHGADVLRQQLSALDAGHLRGIVLAYDLAPVDTVALAEREKLVETIMAAVTGSAVTGSTRDGNR